MSYRQQPYESLPTDEEDHNLHDEKRHLPLQRSRNGGSLMWTVLTVLLVLNIAVAGANAFYSMRASRVMDRYSKKDISQLPRPDPFVGLKLPKSKPGKNATDLDGY